MCVVETRKERQKQPHFSSSSLFPQPVTSPPLFLFSLPASSSSLLHLCVSAVPLFSSPFLSPPPRKMRALFTLILPPFFLPLLLRRRQRPIYPGLSGILSLPPSSSSLLVNESIAIVQRKGPRREDDATTQLPTFPLSFFWFRYQYTVMMIPGAPQKKFFLHGREDLQNLPNPQPPTLLTFFLVFWGQASSVRCCD